MMRKYNYIYKITNNINGKIYIGKHSTDDLDQRNVHIWKMIDHLEKMINETNEPNRTRNT